MISISLCMIVKNEEAVLSRCLKSCKNIFDEIIIVDTGSSDNTKNIAKQFTNKVYDFFWQDDFSLARNFSFSKATCDYIMWLDADDVIPAKSVKKLLELKEQLSTKNYDVIMAKYDISFDANGKPNFSYFRERILKKSCNFTWQDPVHEVIIPSGNIFYSNISIEHRKIGQNKKSNRNLKIYENLLKKGIKLNARQMYYYSRELMFNRKYKKAIISFNKFLKMPNIWTENAISACIDLSNCYLQLSDNNNAKLNLIRSFYYDIPRAEALCKLADIYFNENNYQKACYWYNLALKDKCNLTSGAFVQKIYYDVYPLLQLCVCYYYLGDIKKAKECNNKVGKIDSKIPVYVKNKALFDKLNV